MRLHVVTAVTRPENLAVLAASLAGAAVAARVDVSWHWVFDLDRRYVGGQKRKNDALDEILDGWVWFLDDDTSVDVRILSAWRASVDADPSLEAVVFGQVRADGRILEAAAELVRVGDIDIGQAFVRRDAIGMHRLDESYDGDGVFLAAVLPRVNVLFHDEYLSRHNLLVAA